MISNAENFSTHALSALFILPLGFWFTFNVFFRYYKAELLQSDSFKSSLSFPWRNRVAVDMYFLGTMAVTGFLVLRMVRSGPRAGPFYTVLMGVMGLLFKRIGADIVANGGHDWSTESKANSMHRLPIYLLYEAAAVAAILKLRKWNLPENLEYVLFAFASSLQGYLLYAHTIQPKLHSLYHGFGFALNAGTTATTLVEMAHPRNVLAALSKCFFLTVSATWYFTLSLVLYPPSGKKVDGTAHENMMLVPIFFVWNMIFVVLMMTVIGMIQYQRVREFERSKSTSRAP